MITVAAQNSALHPISELRDISLDDVFRFNPKVVAHLYPVVEQVAEFEREIIQIELAVTDELLDGQYVTVMSFARAKELNSNSRYRNT